MKFSRYKIISVITILVLLLIWYLLTNNQPRSSELLFPSLNSIVSTLKSHYIVIFEYTLITWHRVIIGLLIGAILGILFGILITWNRYFEAIIDPIIEIIRPIPPIALTPFFILWFGLGNMGQFLLIALGCFMVVVVSTVTAINNVNVVYIRAAKSLGANTIDIYRTILIPAILPTLSSAIRVSAATGFGLTVAAEYLGAQGGLGYLIRNARVTLNTDTILLAAILLGLLSLLTDFIIRKLFTYLTRWNNV
ncbi:MAG: ABC transporter permease subunit [Flavobacteriaceae bacterium]